MTQTNVDTVIQLRDAVAAMRTAVQANASSEIITEISLKIASLQNQLIGKEAVQTLAIPKVKRVKINDGEKQIRRCYFHVRTVDVRLAKSVLQQAFGLTYLPNAQLVFGGETYQIVIPWTTFTACDQVYQAHQDLFLRISTEPMSKHAPGPKYPKPEATEAVAVTEPVEEAATEVVE